MIKNKELYMEFLIQNGVGKNDVVASSPKSYISYLNGVSKLLNCEISEAIIQNQIDIDNIINGLKGQRKKTTLQHYKTALNQYLKFLQHFKFLT